MAGKSRIAPERCWTEEDGSSHAGIQSPFSVAGQLLVSLQQLGQVRLHLVIFGNDIATSMGAWLPVSGLGAPLYQAWKKKLLLGLLKRHGQPKNT